MSQQDLFNTAVDLQHLPLANAKVCYVRDFIPGHAQLFTQLKEQINWQQDTLKMFGRRVKAPRLSAWYGDDNANYGYSGLRLQLNPWLPVLLRCKMLIEDRFNVPFNSVLANYYRTGQDSVGWHSDDEVELGADPIIASLSFGDIRRFSFKSKTQPKDKPVHIDLEPGSLLLMAEGTQNHWLHQLPKSNRDNLKGRINLTFRQVAKL